MIYIFQKLLKFFFLKIRRKVKLTKKGENSIFVVIQIR